MLRPSVPFWLHTVWITNVLLLPPLGSGISIGSRIYPGICTSPASPILLSHLSGCSLALLRLVLCWFFVARWTAGLRSSFPCCLLHRAGTGSPVTDLTLAFCTLFVVIPSQMGESHHNIKADSICLQKVQFAAHRVFNQCPFEILPFLCVLNRL